MVKKAENEFKSPRWSHIVFAFVLGYLVVPEMLHNWATELPLDPDFARELAAGIWTVIAFCGGWGMVQVDEPPATSE